MPPLSPHSEAAASEDLACFAAVERVGSQLRAVYVVDCHEGRLLVPASKLQPERRDGLWQTTCFELFVRADGRDGYVEFNFAPSGDWAAYSFDGYRQGMADLPLSAPPAISVRTDRTGAHTVQHSIHVDLILSDRISQQDVLRANLTAVIEETNGTKSYWALAHPAGAPDFHHPDCFVLQLPPSDGL